MRLKRNPQWIYLIDDLFDLMLSKTQKRMISCNALIYAVTYASNPVHIKDNCKLLHSPVYK